MKLILAAGAAALLSVSALAVTSPAAADTVVHDKSTGTTYIYKDKAYPRVKQAWTAPAGWDNRVYVVGDTVPETFWSPTYVIDTTAYPQLPRHTGDTKWVRIGNDAVLIRVGTGNVVERIENFYY